MLTRLPSELVSAFARCFVHRFDAFALQQRDGSYRCMAVPLTEEMLVGHLQARWTVGTYVLDAQSTCRLAVFDADREDGFAVLLDLATELAREGVQTLLEPSRRGGHLWLHFAEPLPARQVRAWLAPYAFVRDVELYPKQDALSPGGFGSLIRLPLGVHRKSRQWYPFVVVSEDGLIVPVGNTVEQCCAWACSQITFCSVHAQVAPMEQKEGEVLSWAALPALIQPTREGSIREWCAAQDIVSVTGRYVELDRRGVGSCPFKEHHYRGDRRPSFQVFGDSDPHWYCYTWGRVGDLFTFLCLYHNLSVQEGWQRLREGTLY